MDRGTKVNPGPLQIINSALANHTFCDQAGAPVSDSIGQCTRCFQKNTRKENPLSFSPGMHDSLFARARKRIRFRVVLYPRTPRPFWKKFHRRPCIEPSPTVGMIYADDLSLRLARPCWKLLLARRGTVFRYLMRPVPVVCLLLAFSPQLSVVSAVLAVARCKGISGGSRGRDGVAGDNVQLRVLAAG